jgi:hypothetical protein
MHANQYVSVRYGRSEGTARSKKGALEKDGSERLVSLACMILNLNEKFGAKINYDIVGVHHVKWRR